MKKADKRLALELTGLGLATAVGAVAVDPDGRKLAAEAGHTVATHVAETLGSTMSGVKDWLHAVDPSSISPNHKL